MSSPYNNSARMSPPPGAYYLIQGGDFGAPVPALINGDLAYNSSAGSLAMGTAYIKITWITTEGESLPSAEASVTVSAGSGAVTITQPTPPSNAVGWRVYSKGTTAGELLNTASNSTTQTQTPFVVNKAGGGTAVINGFTIATTAVQVLIYGTGAAVPVVDNSGVQDALPTISANTTSNYYARVPNTGSQWKVQKSVNFMRSDGTTETAGIVISKMDCIQPLYPGTAASVTAGVYMVMNGYLFKATVGGTTASTFIGFSNFNTTKGATTTDNSVTWTSYGKAALVRFLFGNVSASAATPVSQPYELFEQ